MGCFGTKFAASAAGAMALCLASGAAAGPILVVSAHDEFDAAHPGHHAKAQAEDFRSTMDRVFGPGRWRQTSGYRTQAQEDALRRQGAGTVAPGRISLHSVGGASSPGAYDAVVDRMSAQRAAERLKSAGGAFSRVLAERAHGPQGEHLHIELTRGAAPALRDTIYRPASGGRRRALLAQAASSGAGEN